METWDVCNLQYKNHKINTEQFASPEVYRCTPSSCLEVYDKSSQWLLLDCLCEVLWGSVVPSAKPYGASRSWSWDQQLCDCLWVSIPTVGVDLPRACRLSGGFTFAGLLQLHNEHCWLWEQRRASKRVSRCSCACTCLCEQPQIAGI